MDDIYAYIANAAGSGSATTGEISTGLLNLGLTVEAVRNALNIVAQNVGQDPNQVAAVAAELRFVNSGGLVAAQNSGKKTLLLLGAAAVALYLFTRKD